MDDSPLIGPQGWRPENFGSVFRGMVTVRQALSWSYNIPAIRAYTEHTGLQKGAEKAYQMGISTYSPQESSPVPSWAIGSREVTALDMTQAYSVFANNGVKMKMHTVRRIEDRNGKVIYEHEAEPEQVLSREAAFITNSILQDVVTTTATGLSGLGRPLAAKTGTTDDERDVYLVAYTPNIVASFWMGYDIKDMGAITRGWNLRTMVVREVFKEIFKDLPRENFAPQPSGVVRVEVCTKSGHRPTELCREAGTVRADYFLRNHVPRLTCDMHVQVDICEASGLLAGEFCPPDQVVQEIRFNRPQFMVTDGGWRSGAGRIPQDAKEMPPEETCDIHSEYSGMFAFFTASASGKRQVKLAWEYTGEALKEFHIYRQIKNGNGDEPQLIKKLRKNERSYKDKTIQIGKTYIYTIYAVNEQGSRSQPAVVEVNVQDQPQEKPGNPEITLSQDYNKDEDYYYVTIQWEARGPMADLFHIYRDETPEPIHTVNVGENYSWTDTEVQPGITYVYRVVAVNDSGSSSSEKSITINDSGNAGGANNGKVYGWNLGERLSGFLAACFSRLSIFQAPL